MKIKHLILAFGGASLLAACNLDEYPYGFYSEDNFYKTEADAESAVNYIYDAINYIEYSRSIVFLGDMNTDDMEPKGDAAAANKELDGWKINNFKTNTTLGNFYKYSYITINRANAVIKKVPGMNIDEAYFMRAYSYFNLARNFGCVPVHTTPVETLEDTAVPAAESLDAMWKLVIEDFKTAGTLLPFFAAPETGRADRAAAYGMLAKAYLYIASAKEHGVPQYAAMSHDVDEYYAEAVKYAGLVVDNPEQTVFRFDDNLLDIYDVERPAGPEHIFIMSMDRTGESEGQYSKISKMYLPYVSGATIYLKQGDSDQMVPTHDGWGEYRTALSFYDAFASGEYARILEAYRREVPAGKKIVMGEIGFKFVEPADSLLQAENLRRAAAHPNASTDDSQMFVYDPMYGTDMADALFQTIHAGYSGCIAWMLDDAMHFKEAPDKLKIWGFWNIFGDEIFGAGEERVRPWYYAWSLLCRTLRPGSDFFAADVRGAAGVKAVAAVKDGRRTVAVVNVSREPRRVRIECPGWERFRQAIRYRYGEGLMRTEGDHTLLPDATGLRIDFRSGAEYDMPGESMILLTEQND